MGNIIFAIAGGLLYRWRGMAHPLKKFFPRPFNQIAFAAPYAYFAYQHIGSYAVIVWVLTTLAVLTGYGGFHDLGTHTEERDDETLEFVIKPLRGDVPEYWYDIIGNAVIGAAISAMLVFTLINAGEVIAGISLLLSHMIGRPLSYAIGWYMWDNMLHVTKLQPHAKEKGKMVEYIGIKNMPRYLDVHTAIGEFLTGAFLWGGLICLMQFV